MHYGISAGHNPAGKVASGAVGFINESTEAREITALVVKYINEIGDTASNCTVNDGTSVSDILSKLKAKHTVMNSHINVSIHFNAGAVKTPDGKYTGVETYTKVNPPSHVREKAIKVTEGIAAFIPRNRGVKTHGLYFVNNVPNSMLIEVCFVDDPEDAKAYYENRDNIARSIAENLTGKSIPKPYTAEKLPNGSYSGRKAIATADLNIRKTRPNDNGALGEIVGSLKKGDEVSLGYCLNGWMGIPCTGGTNGTGFVNSYYLKIV